MAAQHHLAFDVPEPVITNRLTRNGRRIWYQLNVVQLPERARACGAGPKSSADRRPVDPPPVVELRVFEGASFDHVEDITFSYNANFFVFATLEHARVLAHGRVQSPNATTPPVLTGMPVSGMAYLDRPREAGYFLFPDLSVRHEGRYRLSFNLFEQTKEHGDLDHNMIQFPAPFEESFDWRMEVKSNDFTVFSAKKIPGLTESTALSRTVAEQGCRVRIRRDVRMRRREGKASTAAAANDVRAAGEDYVRHRRTQTPDTTHGFRARSLSNESMAHTPYALHTMDSNAALAQRRPSMTEYHQPQQHLIPHHTSMSPPQQPQPQQQQQHSSHQPMTPAYGVPQPQPQPQAYHAQAPQVPSSPSYVSSPCVQPPPLPPPRQPQQHSQHPQHMPYQQYTQNPQYTQHAQHQSPPSFSAAPPQSPSQAPSQSQGYYHERTVPRHYAAAPTPMTMEVMSPTSVPAPSPRRESFGSVDYRRMSNSFPVPAEMTLDRSPEATRSMSPMLSPYDTKATTTLPSLSEMISFGSDKPDKNEGADRNEAAPPPPAAPGSSHSSMSTGYRAGSISSDSTGSPNSDRVPSLSQLLLPQPVVLTSPPAEPAAPKKRSFGQYSNIDSEYGMYTTEVPVKNLARQPETVQQDYGEMCWKRADGTVWSMQGKLANMRA